MDSIEDMVKGLKKARIACQSLQSFNHTEYILYCLSAVAI